MLVAAFTLFLVAASSTPPTNSMNVANRKNWTDEPSPGGFHPKAICRASGDPKPPAADWPTRKQRLQLEGCNSTGLYYGQGIARDYRRARMCAIPKAGKSTSEGGGDSIVLAQIYANGLGVRRNYRLAIAYACQSDGTYDDAAFIAGLESMRSEALVDSGLIDWCDSATDSFVREPCARIEAGISDTERNSRLERLLAHFSPLVRSSFNFLKNSFESYIQSQGRSGLNESKIEPLLKMIEHQEMLRADFENELRDFLAGAWSPPDSTFSDEDLDKAYGFAVTQSSRGDLRGLTPYEVRKSQAAWRAYRDAFVRFAAVASPSSPKSAVIAHLSTQRAKELRGLGEPDEPSPRSSAMH